MGLIDRFFNWRWGRFFVCCLALLLAVYLALPFVLQCLYTLPAADDFFNNFGDGGDGPLLAALRTTVSLYQGWQGTYTGAFLSILCRPFYYGGLTGVHVALLVIVLLFLCSLALFISRLLALVVEKPLPWYGVLLIACGFFAGVTVAANSSDTFTWLSAAWVYTIPLSILFFAGALLACSVLRRRTALAILSGVLFLLAAGGTLPVAALGCLVALGGVVLALGAKAPLKGPLIAFLLALAGALVNAAAPGNFVRHAVITPDYNVLKALAVATRTCFAQLQTLLLKTPTLPFLLCLFAFALRWPFSARMRAACRPGVFLLFLIGLPAIVLVPFPVALGYDGEIALRAYVVVDTALMAWLTLLAVYGACYVQCATPLRFQGEHRALIIGAAVCVFLAGGGLGRTLQYQQTTIWAQLASGQYAAFYEERSEILRQIETVPEPDVVVVMRVAAPDYIRDIGLTEYPRYFNNTTLAGYYGKNSVAAVWELPDEG